MEDSSQGSQAPNIDTGPVEHVEHDPPDCFNTTETQFEGKQYQLFGWLRLLHRHFGWFNTTIAIQSSVHQIPFEIVIVTLW